MEKLDAKGPTERGEAISGGFHGSNSWDVNGISWDLMEFDIISWDFMEFKHHLMELYGIVLNCMESSLGS